MNFSVREPMAWSAASSRSTTPSCSPPAKSGRAVSCRRQHGGAPAAGAGAALLAAAGRADRRHPAARRVERGAPAAARSGQVLASHPDAPTLAVIGSAPDRPRGDERFASDTPGRAGAVLELGAKNALIVALPTPISTAVSAGGGRRQCNFNWCGQSCGSTSRAFIHENLRRPCSSARQELDPALPAGRSGLTRPPPWA